MEPSWDDLRLFAAVARLGGLSAARAPTGLSAATLGRRVAALERAIGRPLFERSQRGYALTPAGEELLVHAGEVEAAMRGLRHWQEGTGGARIVRISAGSWTSEFLARNVGALWQAGDPMTIELVTATAKVDIGRRNADIGIRNARPIEPLLAGRMTGRVAYALYSGRNLVSGIKAGLFVGIAGEAAQTQASRWLEAHHGDRIALRGNDPHAVRELVAAGAGLSVFPCFVGDADPRLVRIARPPIRELETEQWLVSHHEERHLRPVREILERIARLMNDNAPLLSGQRPLA